MNLPILAFVKYGCEEHIRSMQQGKLFFNTIQYFAKCDSSSGRGDEHEIHYKQTYGEGATFDLTKETFNLSTQMIRLPNGTYKVLYTNQEFYANLFCLYSVISDKGLIAQQIQFSDEMKSFGTHMLLIFNPMEFVTRVRHTMVKQVKNLHSGPVRYIDMNTLNGSKSYFDKPMRYSYQNEYRIAFQNDKEQAALFEIGSIEDISIMFTVEECKGLRIFDKSGDMNTHLDYLQTRLVSDYKEAVATYEYLKSKQVGVNVTNEVLLSEIKKNQAHERLSEFMKRIKYKGL